MSRNPRRGSPALFIPLLALALLFLTACGTFEVGIERTAMPDDTATAPAVVTRTPLPTLSGSAHATISALATENAHLATQVAAQATSSEFWANVGVSPDALVAVQTRPDSAPFQFGDIATMRADGTQLVQLTSYRYNADPVLSPDGERIAYRSVPASITSLSDPGERLYEGSYNVWVITSDYSQAWQLTSSEEQRGVPVWSPDSQKVAFNEGTDGLLVEAEVDTGLRREIVRGASAPRYRPDGEGIGYVSADGGLAWMDSVGAAHTIVPAVALPAHTSVKDFDWLPDGGRVVYTLADASERQGDTTLGIEYSLWIAQADGSNPLKLADDARDARVSPDGHTIAALQGSGWYDACFVDQGLVFLLLATDLASARRVGLDGFEGYPQTSVDQSFYPLSEAGLIAAANVTWLSERLALGNFGLTCTTDPGVAGKYLIDPVAGRIVQITRGEGDGGQ
jgi:Tol biopolymer transport system component